MKRLIFLACVLMPLIYSCATVGRQFPVDRVQQIQIGRDTSADIQNRFGTPWRTGIEDGNPTWTYGYYKVSLFGGAQTTDLVIRYDAQGRVASYSFNTTE